MTALDRFLEELEPLAEHTRDLVAFQAIRAVVERHGAGPYLPKDLGALAGVDTDTLRRVLAEMTAQGLAIAPPAAGLASS